ncbi:MAG: 4Fe-4S binding protein [Desulfobacteraceae bacterium]|nr:MAG: 4Fe-4S binding protein [Desulfobacteraceae bacterium]
MKTIKENLPRILQYTVRIAILVFVTYLAVMHQLKGVLAAPNIHVFCPFGGLEALYRLVLSGKYIEKIMPATLILLAATVLLAIALNRAFCGWICPLGTLQKLFDRLGRLLRIRKTKVPQRTENALHGVKYAGLVIILIATWKAGALVYAPYDPWASYAHIAAGWQELYHEFLIGTLFLLAALIGSLWLPNNFCRWFCPMGAFLGILSKLSPARIRRNDQTCIHCKKCDQACPAQIAVESQPAVKSGECFACGDCLAVCPKEKTIDFYFVRRRLDWLLYGVIVLVLFFGPVLLSKQLGWWKTGYTSAAEALTSIVGAKDPALIKGSMTPRVVSTEFGIPLETLFKSMNLPADTKPDEMLKNIAAAERKSPEVFLKELRSIVSEHIKNK